MTGVPTYMSGSHVVITRTMNGFAIQAAQGDPIEAAVTFANWADLAYYLDANFNAAPAA